MPPTLSTADELAKYPPDIQASIRKVEQGHVERFRYYTERYSHTERLESGGVIHYDKDGAIMENPVDYFFGLSYASWLTLPRLALQEMGPDWQARFVDLMEEGYARGLAPPDDTYVMRRVGGKFVSNDHWNNYRRGTVAYAQSVDESLKSG
jgi:hypothetical protein